MNEKPKFNFKAGNVEAAVWENEAEVDGVKRKFLNATCKKNYKDGDAWKSTNSYGINELPKLIHLLNLAYGKMLEKPEE